MMEDDVPKSATIEQKEGVLADIANANHAEAEAAGFTRFNNVSRLASVVCHMFNYLRVHGEARGEAVAHVLRIPDTQVSYCTFKKKNVLVPSPYMPSWILQLGAICADPKLSHDTPQTIYIEAVEALRKGLDGDMESVERFLGGTELAKEYKQ